MRTSRGTDESVAITPVPGYFIPGVPAVTQTLPAAEAEALLAHTPAAFTREVHAPARDAPGPLQEIERDGDHGDGPAESDAGSMGAPD